MKIERYPLKAEESLTVFEFISNGPKGLIPKIVIFNETNLKGFYNLAFGDKDINSGNINDLAVSNNGDSEKVLATVVASVYAFTDKYPNSFIYATGSTKARTRLYRMGITNILVKLRKTSIFMDCTMMNGKFLRRKLNMKLFLLKEKNSNFTYGY